MTEKVQKLTEKTLVPLSLVLSLLGGGSYVATISTKLEASEKEISALRVKQDQYAQDIVAIRVSLAEIATELKARRRDARLRD